MCSNEVFPGTRSFRAIDCGLSAKLSKGELKIANLFEKNEFKYEIEYCFEDLFNPLTNIPLYFDFAIYGHGEIVCLIEYQGHYHYKPIFFDGAKTISLEQANLNLKSQQYRDQLKRDYCKENNIPLIEIPYWEFEAGNLENYLLKKIEQFTR